MRDRSDFALRVNAPFRSIAQRLAVPFFVVVSLLLIFLGKADLLVLERVRMATADMMAPVLAFLATPAASIAEGIRHVEDLSDVYGENLRLRQDNARLLQWQTVARRLAVENAQLRALTRYQPRGASFSISAQVIANSGGAFAHNVLVDAGAREGVARGQAGMTGEGLIGRVAEVGDRTARILLLTDLNSRLPVVVGGAHQRAVLAGDNSSEPLLLFLPLNAAVKVGDRIVTGGAEGVFPPDLPVGVVASIDGDTVRVTPYAELARLDYVRVVDLGMSAFLPQAVAPQARPDAGWKPAAKPVTR
ncbi:MAG TPA: rod shape-determining protein MreC [Stellaceae bacterium]|nr:rod shape-determining protein MreC [Stellaceae bacterium]